MPRPRKSAPTPAAVQLAYYFSLGGYVRRQNPERAASGDGKYKKGDEARILVDTRQDLRFVRSLLDGAGFVPGAWFLKGKRYCQPLYGRESVARFLALIGR